MLAPSGCDGKLTKAHRWQGAQRRRALRTGGLTAYLKRNGGYCDCEVLMNVYPSREPDGDGKAQACKHTGRGW